MLLSTLFFLLISISALPELMRSMKTRDERDVFNRILASLNAVSVHTFGPGTAETVSVLREGMGQRNPGQTHSVCSILEVRDHGPRYPKY